MNNKPPGKPGSASNYVRPTKTAQELLSKQDIYNNLKEYKKVADIRFVPIGTHIRYFSIDPKTGEKQFRLGGTLDKVDPEGRFIKLSNGTISWSVQIATSTFYQKMTEAEIRNEIKKELKQEIMTEECNDGDSFKKEIKNLKKELESFKNLEKEYKNLEKEYNACLKENASLKSQLEKIAFEIKTTKENKKK